MVLSALCVVHCIALPFIVAGIPFLGAFTDADWVHQVLVLMAAPLSLWAISYSKAWRKWAVSLPMSGGLLLLALAAFVPALHDAEVALSLLGAVMIAAAHGINYLSQRPVHIHSATCAHGAD
ncbi:putative membrane protein [Asticcacaulis biprosthecium C19]|uniref:Putative membrane protein n=2 Tax=Asticcacaulis biprosthecium TaxID=76891 RepID=F4QMX6_9CAUL|nr:putative membrane protein [Asticcacaulis biprosthecium C19]